LVKGNRNQEGLGGKMEDFPTRTCVVRSKRLETWRNHVKRKTIEEEKKVLMDFPQIGGKDTVTIRGLSSSLGVQENWYILSNANKGRI